MSVQRELLRASVDDGDNIIAIMNALTPISCHTLPASSTPVDDNRSVSVDGFLGEVSLFRTFRAKTEHFLSPILGAAADVSEEGER